MDSNYYKILDYDEKYLDYLFTIHKENFQEYFIKHYGKWNDNRQKKSFKKMMESGFYKMIEFNGEIVGAISYEEGLAPYESPDNKGKPSVLWYLNIDKKLHNKGLGSAILRNLIKQCRYRFDLKVYKDNFAAQAFYKKHQFLFVPNKTDDDFYTMTLFTGIYTRYKTAYAASQWLIQEEIKKYNNGEENT